MASLTAINNLGDYAHNPRGNIWFNDESTYGHKLLLKMGWNKGKGLGKNENGIKENVKAKFRSTNSGLGFKDDAYKNIMSTEYESILKNLHAEYSDSKSIPGKESDKQEKEYNQKSKVVKSKLRYPKLFFGKDVTKYSDKDMKSIFICSLPVKDDEEKVTKDLIISQEEKSEIEPPKTVSSGLSISDYFNKKMEEKKSKMLNKELDNSSDHHVSVESINLKYDSLTSNKNGLSKRKKKHVETNINEEFSNAEGLHQNASECQNSETQNIDSLPEKKSSKKKKRKSEISTNIEEALQECMDNNGPESCNTMKQNILEVPMNKNNISEDIKTQNDNFCRPSSKKRKTTHILANGNDSVKSQKLSSKCIISEAELPSIVIKKKKKKSLNVHALPLESLHHDKGKKLENFKTIVDNFPELQKSELSSTINHSKKNKKLKKNLKQKLKSCLKNKSGLYSLKKRVSFNESVSYRTIDSAFESVEYLADENRSLGVDTSCKIVNVIDRNSSDDGLCEIINIDESNSSDDSLSEIVNIDNNNSSKDALYETANIDNCNSTVACSVKNECSVDSYTKGQGNTSEMQLGAKYALSCLPSSKSSHYNCWIESQRQALKMKLYKDIFKNIRKHKTLRTTNLHSIQGYGNWGFN